MIDRQRFLITAAMQSMLARLGVDVEFSCRTATQKIDEAIAVCHNCPHESRCFAAARDCIDVCPNAGRFQGLPRLIH